MSVSGGGNLQTTVSLDTSGNVSGRILSDAAAVAYGVDTLHVPIRGNGARYMLLFIQRFSRNKL